MNLVRFSPVSRKRTEEGKVGSCAMGFFLDSCPRQCSTGSSIVCTDLVQQSLLLSPGPEGSSGCNRICSSGRCLWWPSRQPLWTGLLHQHSWTLMQMQVSLPGMFSTPSGALGTSPLRYTPGGSLHCLEFPYGYEDQSLELMGEIQSLIL